MPLTTLSCSAQPHDPEPPVIRVRCSSTELQLQPLCACRLRGTVALVAALPKPARGLGHSVTIHMAGEIACADLGDKVPALAGMSFVQWGEDVPPPLSPSTGIDGPWLARLGLAAPAPPRRLPPPPPLARPLGRPCSVRWHGQARTVSWPFGDDPQGGRGRGLGSLGQGAGAGRHVVCSVGRGRSAPPLPSNGNRRAVARSAGPRCARSTPSIPAAPLPRRRSWASVFRPMAWPSPDRRSEGNRDDDPRQPGKLAQSGGGGHGPAL